MEGEVLAESNAESLTSGTPSRSVWRSLTSAFWEAILPIAPAVLLLWLPTLIASLGLLPGADQAGHTALSIPALMVGGLAPLWIAAGWARLRGRSISGMIGLLREHGWLGARLLRFIILAFTIAAFFGSFAKWKSAIPLVYPGFRWDAPLEVVDMWIHGDHPDRILAPLFGSPEAILFLDRVYHTWFYMLFTLVIWQAWQNDPRRLRQFWMAFALTWIVLGIFVACAAASAGPIYAGLDRGSISYDDLLARLSAAERLGPLFVRMSAWSLWEAVRQPGIAIGDGISAFPSLHVAVVSLAMFPLWRIHPGLGLCGAVYTLLIVIGSIMLGWHYAVDGEAGVLGAALIWIAAGRWANRFEKSRTRSLAIHYDG
jgi:hypothetical protein